jgi:hypothetical protein
MVDIGRFNVMGLHLQRFLFTKRIVIGAVILKEM